MGISYDPSKVPDFDPEEIEEAVFHNLIPISVICFDNNENDDYGVQFDLYVNIVPRIGERMILQDETCCEVTNVYHKVVKPPENKATGAFVTLMARRISRRNSA